METTTSTNGKNNKAPTVRGVKVDKVDRKLLLAAGTKLEVFSDADAKKPIGELVERFDDKMRAAVNGNVADLLRCDTCGGRSTEDLTSCPYCGDSEGDGAAAAPVNAETKPAAAPEKEAPVKTEETPKRTKTKSGDAKAAAEPDKPSTKKAKAAEPVAAIVEDKPAPKAIASATEKDLDAAVMEVQILKAEGAVNLWKLGAKIKSIHDSQLYKQRTDGGKPKYKGFEAFCNHELGISFQNAYELMDVAAKFSEQQVRKFGTSKLGLLLKAPEEAREDILDKVAKGATANEVRADVRAARERAGIKPGERTARDPKRKAMPTGKGGVSAKAERITIANVLGRHRLKMFQKGTGKNGEDAKRAKNVGDQPWAVLELSNSVKLYVAIVQDPAGELIAVLDFKRAD